MTVPVQQPAQPVVDMTEVVYEDYWGFEDKRKFVFPDGKQYLMFNVMNEGARKRYQSKTRTGVTLMRNTGDAKMSIDQATERHELIAASVCDWFLFKNGEQLKFTDHALRSFLDHANPRLVDDIEKEIRKANPWLLSDMTSEDIQKQIDDLEEMKTVALEREKGEGSSSGK